MRNRSFISGQWNAVCDVCGFDFKNTDLQRRWDGLMVCRSDWETRHPQDLIRPIPDTAQLPWTRPTVTEVPVPNLPNYPIGPTPFGVYANADYAQADFAVVGQHLEGLL